MSGEREAGSGCGCGSLIAAILSWMTWHSVGWAIIHFILGWLYVIYWMIYYWH